VNWIDLFTRNVYKDILLKRLAALLQTKRLEVLQQKLKYIHNNQVTARIVDKPEEYLYSSAMDYYYGNNCGLFPVTFVE
jgi:hypothetical protein